MAFDNIDLNIDAEIEDTPSPGGTNNNRIFIVAAGILGAIALLALAGIAVYGMVLLPQRRNQAAQQLAAVSAQNTQVAAAITQTSAAAIIAAAPATATPTATRLPGTATPTLTPVVAQATQAPAVTQAPDGRTATVAALLTQVAQANLTAVPTKTALPKTGFADDVGMPGMLGVSGLLIAVFFLARRLRAVM